MFIKGTYNSYYTLVKIEISRLFLMYFMWLIFTLSRTIIILPLPQTSIYIHVQEKGRKSKPKQYKIFVQKK
jgi:hypothetical protein